LPPPVTQDHACPAQSDALAARMTHESARKRARQHTAQRQRPARSRHSMSSLALPQPCCASCAAHLPTTHHTPCELRTVPASAMQTTRHAARIAPTQPQDPREARAPHTANTCHDSCLPSVGRNPLYLQLTLHSQTGQGHCHHCLAPRPGTPPPAPLAAGAAIAGAAIAMPKCVMYVCAVCVLRVCCGCAAGVLLLDGRWLPLPGCRRCRHRPVPPATAAASACRYPIL
jgi:hypothetical protein